ncbi:MAG: hypothetical protein IT249_08760 [Chitinophagaceae bacterium]|nr:hypothetical protein [Chitinophagaceae bacterium]
MPQLSIIPLLNFVKINAKFPDVVFQGTKRTKGLQIIYTLLSKQYARILTAEKNLLIFPETLSKIKEYLTDKFDSKKHSYGDHRQGVSSLTIQDKNNFETYVFIISTLNDNSNINILSYNDVDFTSWLGGVVQKDDDIHISVQYNLTENEVIHLLDLFNFVIELTNLKDFELIYCNSNETSKNLQKNITSSGLLIIDISSIRKYLVQATERKEHFRWQFCGPGRTILRKIKVKNTTVKQYVRRGKRI